MKTTVNITTIFKYVLLFTFLFAAFLSLAITYNKIFKLKNEIITIAEKYDGIQTTGLKVINKYLNANSYNTTGTCEVGEYGVKDLNSNIYEKVASNREKYYYCLSYKVVSDSNINQIYYNVKLFYKFNLPFLGELLTFKITGETKGIKYYSEKQKLS